MNSEHGQFNAAVLRKMASQLQTVMMDIETNSMISISTRQKMQHDMGMQLAALNAGADELERAYGKAPQVIEGTPFANESGNA